MKRWVLIGALIITIVLYAFQGAILNGPIFYSIQFDVNGKVIEVQNSSILDLRSDDQLYIKHIKTNLPLNIGVKLKAEDLDVDALLASPQRFEEVLSDWKVDKSIFSIWAYFLDKSLGQIFLKMNPLVEDWLERASLIVDPEKRLFFLFEGIRSTEYAEPLVAEYLESLTKLDNVKKRSFLERLDPEGLQDKKLIWLAFNLARELGDETLVETYGKRILEEDPSDIGAIWMLGSFYEEKGDLNKAELFYKEGLASERGPNREFILGLARVLIGRGELSQARVFLETLVEAERDQEYYQLLAKVSKDLGDKRAYFQAMDGYLRLRPGDLEGRVEFLRFLLENQFDEEANLYVQDIISKSVGEPEILIKLVQILEGFKKLELLEKAYTALIREGVDDSTIFFNIAALEYERGNYSKAKEYFELYVQKNKTDEAALKILLDIYKKDNNIGKILETANQLISIGVKESWIYELLYSIYIKLQEYEIAIQTCKEAIKLFPNDKSFYECLAASYLQKKRPEDAQKVLELYLKSFPSDTKILLRLADIKQARGDKKGALKALEEYLQLKPEDQEVQERYLRLRIEYLEEKG